MRLSSPGWITTMPCIAAYRPILRHVTTSPKFSSTIGVWLSPKKSHRPSLRTTALVTYPTTYCIQALPTCIQIFERTSPAVHNRAVVAIYTDSQYQRSGQLHTCTYGNRRISYAAPWAWNNLPADLRNTSISVDSFKSKLKTHFYRQAFITE